MAPIRSAFLELWMGSIMVLFPAPTGEYWWRSVDFPLIPCILGPGEGAGYDAKKRDPHSSFSVSTKDTVLSRAVKRVSLYPFPIRRCSVPKRPFPRGMRVGDRRERHRNAKEWREILGWGYRGTLLLGKEWAWGCPQVTGVRMEGVYEE